jgi:thiol-disulfide isomerase/thioredoxin
VKMMERLFRGSCVWTIVLVGLAAAGGAAEAPAPRPTPVPSPAPGDVIAPFEAMGIDGKKQSLDFPKGSKTLLLFFLSGCSHCHKMIPEWNRAFKEKAASLTVRGVVIDADPPGVPPAFFIMMPIDFPVLRTPGRAVLDKMKVYKVPQMVRVGPGGKVEDAAQGEIDRMRIGQLFKP